MVLIRFSKPDFEYDVQSLVKSFYPEEEVSVVLKEGARLLINVEYFPDSVAVKMEDAQGVTREETEADSSDRKQIKNRLKTLLYRMLREKTGTDLPWGTLSGIRPTKIPLNLYEEGRDEEFIRSYMKETYLVSDGKIQLSMEVAKKELEVLKNTDYKNGYSLYIGIPFCPSICSYCSFSSYPIGRYESFVEPYLEALKKEIDYVAKAYKDKKINSVYIGGGTPTSLSAGQLDALLAVITASFDLSRCPEFTVEAGRPDSITAEKLNVIKKHGVDRISINPQTMKQDTLDIIGRNHSVLQTKEAFRLARECGFTNINMDLIIGLPDETRDDVRDTMDEILLLAPDCITIHSLAIKRAARMNTEKEEYKDYTNTNNEELMDLTAEYADRMGLEPYYLYRQKNMAGNMENVGYAAPGKAGVYNILMMEEKQSIAALGAGAVSKIVYENGRIERISNVKNVEQYIERIEEMIQRKANYFEAGEL
ncbi:coproporphyrinogen dehydrogenase HemZ [Parasporobacterium paucivorans]|uniref:Oxygen-independent coproporphyrinogen-3 oxidase n=1 Tax=Parasporobacterium paucivorans DSM 15970 TaxID=1122934 RepID=A0A1M6C5V7_9FIRM|nr:coproporphyrinogen dehydrogenase HemZ [Parasporobacterium paucivorans]SHI56134.1 oxygen-independent coproporphyrinogen-3 oxidase [Parasporobacterium paucivorans DSM 15970]